jgi:hypothetical protein
MNTYQDSPRALNGSCDQTLYETVMSVLTSLHNESVNKQRLISLFNGTQYEVIDVTTKTVELWDTKTLSFKELAIKPACVNFATESMGTQRKVANG